MREEGSVTDVHPLLCPVSGKRRYRTEDAARLALEMVQVLRWHGEEPRPHRAYPCPSCHDWHLTKKKPGGKKRSKPGDGAKRKKKWKENQRKKKQAGTDG